MDVLLISPYGDHLDGGIAKWTSHILNYYKSHNSDLELKLLCNNKMKDSFAGDSMLSRLYRGVKNYYPIYRIFNKVTKKRHYDIVHISTSASFSLLKDLAIAKLAKKRGLKTIIHCHFGRIPDILKNSGWEHILFEQLIKYVDHLVVMDLNSLHALQNYGFNAVTYLPNPLSVSVEKLIANNQNIRRIPNKIVYVGHVVKGKGVFELVDACKQIDGVVLDILGYVPDNETYDKLKEIAGDRYKSMLHVRGPQPFEVVIKEMLSSNIFVLPSYSEGFPNVIIEAMACGCSIVSTLVGAIPEMLNVNSQNSCGLCVEPRDVRQLKEAIEYLLTHPHIASQYGQNAKDRVHKLYSMNQVWNELVSIWEQLLD